MRQTQLSLSRPLTVTLPNSTSLTTSLTLSLPHAHTHTHSMFEVRKVEKEKRGKGVWWGKWRENAESGGEKQWVGQRLRKGTDVLRRIRPYAHVVDTSHRHSLCQACFIPQDKKLKRCAGCKVYYYCSAACQKADWTDHKKECHSLQQVCFVPCASK